MRTGLSYDDVCLIPKYNNIASRTIPDLSTDLTVGTKMGIPIVAANMDTVIGAELGYELQSYGSIPILHRFYKPEEIKELISTARQFNNNCFLSCGVTGLDEFKWFVDDNSLNIKGVCLDIAHGHSLAMFNAINDLLLWRPKLERLRS